MPLTEFLRMSKRKVEATQQRASTSTDPSCRPDTDCVELVWENGQIMMQGQSSKAKKNPVSSQDVKNANGSKMSKFSTMDSVLTDFSMPVSSCEMGLDQDVDMVPWLNYPIEDPLHNDYTSDFLHELSGVAINDLSTGDHLASREKKSSFHGDVISQDCATPSSLCAFTNMRLLKLNAGQPSTSSSFTNFSHFAQSTSVGRANHPSINSSNKLENDEKMCTLSSTNPAESTLVNFSTTCSQKETFSESLPAKDTEEMLSPNQVVYQEGVAKNDVSQNQADGATMAKAGMAGESNMEPVVATSSVCSGNSVERASYEPARNLKRKSRETGESEGPSEELEDESVGARKVALARTGLKRSRAAEVHNLSERRRRDRINEKMRALQELIPNCNKVDKASMLDEAIEYLKTLQLQVQMLSMGAGMYMQPMMLPPGMQPIHGAHMPHFSPVGMGMGMGMGMGYGMNTLDMNTGMKMMPFQGPHYPVPTGPTFPGMPGSNLQAFGHPGQGLPMSMQRPPVLPVSGVPPLKIPIGPNVPDVAGSTNAAHLASSSSSKDVGPQVLPSHNANSSMKQGSNQATNEGIECPATSRDLPQALNPSEAAAVTSGTDSMPS